MRILFTGASSFTGYWFVKELAAAGHEITTILRSRPEEYTGVRRERVDQLLEVSQPVFPCTFGDGRCIETIKDRGPWDVFCHHAADVSNYKSMEFDVGQAVANNTFNLTAVLDALESSGCRKIVMTGSVFEQNEGAGNDVWRAFSPYGLSKGFTADIFRFHAAQRGLKLGKFVIPNPFGPYEDSRFTSYLMQNWVAGRTPSVNTPSYIRDNIHISLLAKAYCHFVENLSSECPRYERLNPSGYVGSQGDFTLRFAREMRNRLQLPCDVDILPQSTFPEPTMRVNTDSAVALPIQWDENTAWDDLADYYQSVFTLHTGKLK